MRSGTHIVLAAAVRFYAPLIVLFAAMLLTMRPAGGGVGFIAGLGFTLVVILHALLAGVDATRKAIPAWAMRLSLALGAISCAVVAAAPGFMFADRLMEAGLFLLTAAGGAAIVTVLFGRAPTMREGAS